MFNHDEIEVQGPMIIPNAETAIKYVQSGYWVSPVWIGEFGVGVEFDLNEAETERFDRLFHITDRSTDGRVHYSRR